MGWLLVESKWIGLTVRRNVVKRDCTLIAVPNGLAVGVMRIGAMGCYTGHLSIKEVECPHKLRAAPKRRAIRLVFDMF